MGSKTPCQTMAAVCSKYGYASAVRRGRLMRLPYWMVNLYHSCNKAAKGRNGRIIAVVAGTKAETVIEILRKIPLKMHKKVSKITLDMAWSMALIAISLCYPGH